MTIQERHAAGVPKTDSSSRRRLKHFFVKPNYQLKFVYYLTIAGVAFFTVTIFFVVQELAKIDAILQNAPVVDAAVRHQIQIVYAGVTRITLFGFGGYVLFTIIFGMIVTHRISGPMLSIVACIEEFKIGNFAFRRGLRPRDELRPIMTALEELGQKLSGSAEPTKR